jgi:hypothetical protein
MSSPCAITLTAPLVISQNLTLDASSSPQPVTVSDGDTLQVFQVSRSITFPLNALTIAHGAAPREL